MKFLVVIALCALAVAATNPENAQQSVLVAQPESAVADVVTLDSRNILVNALIRQLINFIRSIIKNGWGIFGIPPLDPLTIEHFKISVPAGLINLNLELENVFATGFGDFVTHTSTLDLSTLALTLEMSIPDVDISAAKYDFSGDLINAIPLFGKGEARFILKEFRLRATFFLRQSDDGKSAIIDRIENVAFEIPSFKSSLTGVIGGGDIDAIVNALLEEVIIDYINRFQGAIGLVASRAIVFGLNPFLEQLDTWKYLSPFVRD